MPYVILEFPDTHRHTLDSYTYMSVLFFKYNINERMRFTHSRHNIHIMETFYIPTIDHIFLRFSPPNAFSVKQCAVIFQALRCRNFYGLQSLTVSVPLEDILDDQFFWLRRKRTSLRTFQLAF